MIALDDAIKSAKAMKESDWEDLLPLLHVESVDGEQTIMALPEFGGGEQGAALLVVALLAYRQERGDIQSLVFLNDARMRTLEQGEQRPPNDVLEDKWKAGDREGITEVLLVHQVTKDAYNGAFLPYDAEQRTWGEEIRADGTEVGGLIADTLRAAAFTPMKGDS